MQASLPEWMRKTPEGAIARSILSACVHCGFCNATCPTYQLLGNELDGPRGRLYQIKTVLEGQPATAKIQQHLDRCLTCRACETACPSGVQYGRLLDIGRAHVAKQVPRSWAQKIVRKGLRMTLPFPSRWRWAYRTAQQIRPLLPRFLASKIKPPAKSADSRQSVYPRKMLILQGCVQSVITPEINEAAARVLDSLGISLVQAQEAGCCGALSYHLDVQEEGLDFMRLNIDAWWPYVENGVEAIVTTASGCGVMVKEYGQYLANDPDYAEKAAEISRLSRDISEILTAEPPVTISNAGRKMKIAFQSPCTLQHGQKLAGVTERLLRQMGFNLVPVADAHLCCGSAGTYSIFQPEISRKLRDRKLAALEKNNPDLIATANIGCQLHLQLAAKMPVIHWIQLLANDLRN